MKHFWEKILCLYDGLWFPNYTKKRFWCSLVLGFFLYSAISFCFGVLWYFIIGGFIAAILGFVLRAVFAYGNAFFFERDVFVYNTTWNEYLAREFKWYKGIILYVPFLLFTVFLYLLDFIGGVARYFLKKNRS